MYLLSDIYLLYMKITKQWEILKMSVKRGTEYINKMKDSVLQRYQFQENSLFEMQFQSKIPASYIFRLKFVNGSLMCIEIQRTKIPKELLNENKVGGFIPPDIET